jgi:hypothetical protein
MAAAHQGSDRRVQKEKRRRRKQPPAHGVTGLRYPRSGAVGRRDVGGADEIAEWCRAGRGWPECGQTRNTRSQSRKGTPRAGDGPARYCEPSENSPRKSFFFSVLVHRAPSFLSNTASSFLYLLLN